MAVSEVKRFRQALGEWLAGISGMTAQVGTRIYSGWPESSPKLPMITFGLSRAPGGDYPWGEWAGDALVALHAQDEDVLDTIEDLIDNSAGTSLEATLSASGVVLCHMFRLTNVDADDAAVDADMGGLVMLTRRMTFRFVISQTAENW